MGYKLYIFLNISRPWWLSFLFFSFSFQVSVPDRRAIWSENYPDHLKEFQVFMIIRLVVVS